MKPPIPDHWSRILLEIRKDSNITRVDLATYSGIGESTIENYEKRKIVEPSIYKVETLLAAMGYDLDALLVVPGEKDFTVSCSNISNTKPSVTTSAHLKSLNSSTSAQDESPVMSYQLSVTRGYLTPSISMWGKIIGVAIATLVPFV